MNTPDFLVQKGKLQHTEVRETRQAPLADGCYHRVLAYDQLDKGKSGLRAGAGRAGRPEGGPQAVVVLIRCPARWGRLRRFGQGLQ